jgi:hypothetical protein
MIMGRRCVALGAAVVLTLLALPVPAPAQSDSGEIDIVVTDVATKHPLDLARVLLDGPVITSEITESNGKVIFTDVPDGIYRARIVKRGYSSLTSASFEVLDGRLVTVSFALAPDTGGLKVIGEVTAKASATISSSSIDQNSAQRRLSNDLADALNKLSGVSVSTSSDDSDATQTISLEGHDPSQTQLTLDGIPLNAPGSTGNLGAFATDLFSGASVHMGPSLGGLGGSVNFSTLQPTLSWISQLQLSTGSNGRYNYSLAETGSLGKLGLAVQTVDRLNPSLVDGWLYQDASGLDYVHDGDSNVSGDVVNLRYEFGDSNALSGLFMNSTRATNVVCLRYNGDPQSSLPCGYGPNNTDDSDIQLYSHTDNALVCKPRSIRWRRAASTTSWRATSTARRRRAAIRAIRRSTATSSTRRCRRRSGTPFRCRPTAARRSLPRRRSCRRRRSSTTACRARSTTCCRRPTRSIPATSSPWPNRPA